MGFKPLTMGDFWGSRLSEFYLFFSWGSRRLPKQKSASCSHSSSSLAAGKVEAAYCPICFSKLKVSESVGGQAVLVCPLHGEMRFYLDSDPLDLEAAALLTQSVAEASFKQGDIR